MEQPKVIFFDAVGTLFGVHGKVGEVYSAIAQKAGVNIDPNVLNEAFWQSFSEANPPVFPGIDSQQIPEKEFLWWENIAQNTFTKAGVIEQFTDFSSFFTQLYAHFATPEPWYIYDDVIPALRTWQAQGIELGIISNFDTRLFAVIEFLELKSFFTSITLSSIVGAAKPNSKIFLSALDKHNCSPQQAWHIGDSLQDDYYGARAVGIHSFLVRRINAERYPHNQQPTLFSQIRANL
jgi:putative hydrolase of the HAD superfamily